jgi:hypothetical protein
MLLKESFELLIIDLLLIYYTLFYLYKQILRLSNTYICIYVTIYYIKF